MNQKLSWLLTFLVLATGALVEAQQPKKVPRIGYLAPGSPASDSPRIDPFRQGLRELGYTEGQDIVIELRFAEGKSERLPAFSLQLKGIRPAAQALKLNLEEIETQFDAKGLESA